MKRLWAYLMRRARAREQAAHEGVEAARVDAQRAKALLEDAKAKDREVNTMTRQLRQVSDPDVLARWIESALRGNQ